MQRGRRRARVLAARLLSDIRAARLTRNISQRAVAQELGWSHSRFQRFESDTDGGLTLADICQVGAVLGLELGAGLHAVGDGLVDAGHRALIGRFRAVLASSWQVALEVPLAIAGDQRPWDLLLRIPAQLVGVEAETRVRDEQELVRRIRARERDGGADVILLVLSNSAHNRSLVGDLRATLGKRYETGPRAIIAALRQGRPLLGSGVILL